MTGGYVDPATVERLLDECLERMESEPSAFTLWERSFLENVEEYLDGNVITDAMKAKLLEIYKERI